MAQTAAVGPTAEPPPGTEADGVWDVGSIDDTPDPAMEIPGPAFGEPASTDDPSRAGLPRLTEPAQDSDLFDGAAVDVTRLAAGEEREIVVPLEVEEPDRTVQRFKLSIRLRMEPID